MTTTKRILWADDDAPGSLKSLDYLLRKRGLEVEIAADYETASYLLKERQYDAALLDIILPLGPRKLTTEAYQGLRIAELAAESGVHSVVFLTVVPRIEVSDMLRELEAHFPKVAFSFVNKLALLERNVIDQMVNALCHTK